MRDLIIIIGVPFLKPEHLVLPDFQAGFKCSSSNFKMCWEMSFVKTEKRLICCTIFFDRAQNLGNKNVSLCKLRTCTNIETITNFSLK